MKLSKSPARAAIHAMLACASAAVVMVGARDARAYVLKTTTSGALVHWSDSHVDLLVDPALARGVAGASAAMARAATGWQDAVGSGAPTVGVSTGDGSEQPGYDGRNVVFYLAGFEPAGSALAVTLVTSAVATGEILDADVVVNASYDFQVLPADAKNATGAFVSTEGGSVASMSQVFDLVHVLAHETGHVLGMADSKVTTALMYIYSHPDDASVRTPTDDDVLGVSTLYAEAASESHGCVQASHARPGAAAAALALVVLAVGLALRRGRGRRGAMAATAAAVLLAAAVLPARSASAGPPARQTGHARVTRAESFADRGIFRTRLTLAVTDCGRATCPDAAEVLVWGGTVGDVEQQVGEARVPAKDETIEVVLF